MFTNRGSPLEVVVHLSLWELVTISIHFSHSDKIYVGNYRQPRDNPKSHKSGICLHNANIWNTGVGQRLSRNSIYQ
jgi:hypothetical protein